MINFLRGIANAIMYRVVKVLVRLQLFMQMKVGLLNTYAQMHLYQEKMY